LPVWSTSPNEGNTWGLMPVFLHVCPDDQRTMWILAPSVTYNSVIHYTGTVRLYDYVDPDTTFTLIGSASTRINYNLLAMWQRVPVTDGAQTDEATTRLVRTAFTRFYGLGPETPRSNETTYTIRRELASERHGFNLGHHLNLGLTAGVQHDEVEDRGVPGLRLAPEVFPDVPGMKGSTVLWQGIDLRYDNRVGREYTERGVRVEGNVEVVEGVSGSPSFIRGGAQARGVLPELSWLSGAARAQWSAVSSANAPFYLQSQLGGSFVLRGYDEGRFIDQQSWTVEAEQRIRVAQLHLFGVVADLRLDPFVTVGQVFNAVDDALSHPQTAVGVGLRAFVHPSTVGRIDLATGSEGVKVYVEIGYPY
jgi:outer membrane protein assembly factor BamA